LFWSYGMTQHKTPVEGLSPYCTENSASFHWTDQSVNDLLVGKDCCLLWESRHKHTVWTERSCLCWTWRYICLPLGFDGLIIKKIIRHMGTVYWSRTVWLRSRCNIFWKLYTLRLVAQVLCTRISLHQSWLITSTELNTYRLLLTAAQFWSKLCTYTSIKTLNHSQH
jgi:hypothetical protein